MKTDYCLRVLIYVQGKKEKVKIQEIADSYKISKNHLSVAVNQLSELGYLISTPGPKGGVAFNPHFAEKNLGELIQQLESFDIVECFNEVTNTCTLSPRCKLKKMLKGASKSFIQEMSKYKVNDLV